jgi:hypothetical protein
MSSQYGCSVNHVLTEHRKLEKNWSTVNGSDSCNFWQSVLRHAFVTRCVRSVHIQQTYWRAQNPLKTKRKYSSIQNLISDIHFYGVPKLQTFVLLLTAAGRRRRESSIIGMTIKGQKRNLEKPLSMCHPVYHTSYIVWSAIEPRPPRYKACDKLPETWHGRFKELWLAWSTFKRFSSYRTVNTNRLDYKILSVNAV